MKYKVKLELFGHAFNVQVDAGDDAEALDLATKRAKANVKAVAVQVYVDEKKQENAKQVPPDFDITHMLNIFGMKK